MGFAFGYEVNRREVGIKVVETRATKNEQEKKGVWYAQFHQSIQTIVDTFYEYIICYTKDPEISLIAWWDSTTVNALVEFERNLKMCVK